jgi:hypothetical protein
MTYLFPSNPIAQVLAAIDAVDAELRAANADGDPAKIADASERLTNLLSTLNFNHLAQLIDAAEDAKKKAS